MTPVTRMFIVLLILSCTRLPADYVDLKDGSPRTFGVTVAKTDNQLEFLTYSSNNNRWSLRQLQFDAIESHVKTIDLNRLESLSENRISDYRDLGEELASIDNDPAARNLAIRLFAICLHKGDQSIRRSAALNLPGLATTSIQKKNFGLVAYVYGGQSKYKQLVSNHETNSKFTNKLLSLVRSIRQEQFNEAHSVLESMEFPDQFSWVRPAQLRTAIKDQKLEPGLRYRLLQLESELLSVKDNSFLSMPESPARQFESVPIPGILAPNLKEVFDFDLEATLFRDGKWKRP